METKRDERLLDRAVELWVGLLRAPKYDNGATDLANRFAASLAATMPANNDEATLAKFAAELKALLLEADPGPETRMYLSVDYHPDRMLAAAAERAGLAMEFPWKTNMCIGDKSVRLTASYSAPTGVHYPLSDGRWLVAGLEGRDMSKIIALVEAGVLGLDLQPVEPRHE